MKKKLIYLMAITVMIFTTSCDYNEKYFGMDGETPSTDVSKYSYAITDADITTIARALYANKNKADSVKAKILEADKAFSVNAPASYCVPYLLKTKYVGPNKGSSANITYNNKTGASAFYTLSAADYFAVWGNNTVNALTPSHSPASVIPNLLKTKNPNASEGDVRIVEYQYSAVEPSENTVTVDAYVDDFETYTAGTNVAVPVDNAFVVNKDLIGTFFWQVRTFSNNKYAQVTANASTSDNEIWMITKQIDLTDAVNNGSFTFDANTGYVNGECLTVLVSDNFNGQESGIKTAAWTDVTSNFTIVQGTATGYAVLTNAGTMDFKAFAGKKVYIAFKYAGSGISDPKKTTTYQIDNVHVSFTKTATTAATPSPQWGYYHFVNGAWVLETKSFYTLTAQDYTDMGVSTLTSTTAPNYIPTLLKSKFPYAQEGTSKVVVFKTSVTANNADEYILTSGVWKPVSLVVPKTEQFVFSGWDVAGWVFDPTLYVTMKKGKEATDDYMMIVNYVIQNLAGTTPALVNAYGDTEYYYGFAAYYGNISLRESDRLKDPDYAALTTQEQKDKYFTDRTNEGLAIYLSLKYPDAQPQVSGIDVFAMVTCAIYDGVTTSNYTYKFQRVDETPKWKFIERTKL